MTARRMGEGERVSVGTRACFAALMYANSTCSLRDQALGVSECHFPYLTCFENILMWGGRTRGAFCCGTFKLCAGGGFLPSCFAACQIFTSRIYSRELGSITVKMGTRLLFPLRDRLGGKTSSIPTHPYIQDSIQAACHRCPVALRAEIHS